MTEPSLITQTTSLDKVTYLAPFIGMGAAGGVIRAMNTKNFTWKNLITRAITGGFGAALAGLYLKHTPYTIEAQFAMAGAIGAGGVGDLALTYGYERLNFPLMLFTVIVLIVFVQAIQSIGNHYSAKLRNH